MGALVKVDQSVSGSKKGGKSGGGVTGVEYPNTLRSNTTVRIAELISEGEIVGLVNGANSIYFGQTPLCNQDASVNFHGVKYEMRAGTPDQAFLPSNASAETSYPVGTQVKLRLGPVVRTVADKNATSVRVVIQIPTLLAEDPLGNVQPNTTSWRVDVRPADGSWITGQNQIVFQQKCSSPVFFQTDVPLPEGGFPWDIRVVRTAPDWDEVTSKIQGATIWDSYVEIVSAKLTYPNSAVMAMEVNAAFFGQSTLPERFYHVKGLIIEVPSNYNPTTRAYTGVWDGTFQRAWTNNPAWILRDLIVNDRYGLGQFVTADMVDKWALYQIAQYCDELVPDGYGGTEPRYALNLQIRNREEAFKLVQTICSAFRGMAFWSVSQVFATADMPADPVKLVSPANVVGGRFNYSGTSIKARHSVALVTWYDPGDYYRSAVEVVIDEEMLLKFGWRELSIDAKGCTTRSLAHRYGMWALDTEKHAYDTVQYVASFDQADVRPGDIIAIADPHKAQVRAGGRIVAVTSNTVTLDAPFEPGVGQTYSLMIALPDGTVLTAPVSSFSGSVVTLTSSFATLPQLGAMWVITGTDIVPRQYRVLSKDEKAPNEFQITALLHDPTKYARIEEGIQFDDLPYQRPPEYIKAPTNVTFVESIYQQNGAGHARLNVSWTPPDDFQAISYRVTGTGPDGFIDFGTVVQSSIDIPDPTVGDWTFSVTAQGIGGIQSTPTSANYTVLAWQSVNPPYVTHLEVFGTGSGIFGGQDCKVSWRNNFPGGAAEYGQGDDDTGTGQTNPLYRDNIVNVYDMGGSLLRTEVVQGETYIYTIEHNAEDYKPFSKKPQRKFRIEVIVRDILGRQSAPVSLNCENPVPDVVIPILTSSPNSIFASFVRPDDIDFQGCYIWASKNANFDPYATTPVYEGVSNAVSISADPFETYYIRVACYDAFDKFNLNISPPIPITVDGVWIDTSPPPVPTGLGATSNIVTATDGSLTCALNATWNPEPSTWDPPAGAPPTWQPNFSYFEIGITKDGGNEVVFQTSSNNYSWPTVLANQLYHLRIRAVSKNGYPSAWTSYFDITSAQKTTGPGQPTGLSIVSSLKSAFLKWTNPADTDFDHVEIYMSSDTVLANATLVGTTKGSAFTHSGLTTGATYNYWIRAANTSGIFSAFSVMASVTVGQVANGDIAANAITADKIVAASITGDKLVIDTTLPPTLLIGATGVTIGDTTDPATLVNLKSTLIEPGKIQISGGTTLANWRDGADATLITGGAIQTNTIAANKLVIGVRGISITGLTFSFDKVANTVNWDAGQITYVDDDGTNTTKTIAAGSATWTSGVLYINWSKGTSALTTSTSPYALPNSVIIASYAGGINLVMLYGRTQIDGAQIITGSITAAQITAGTITANEIAANAITAGKIAAGAVTADKIAAGTISVTGAIYLGATTFALSSDNQNITIQDTQGTPQTRVVVGKVGTNPTDYGIQIFDSTGALMFSSVSGLTTGGLADGAVTDTKISSLSASKIVTTNLSAISANLGSVTAGKAQSSDGKFVIDLDARTITIDDGT